MCVGLVWVESHLQLADVRIMRRAQWFLISLPMLQRKVYFGVLAAWAIRVREPGSAMSSVVIHSLPLCVMRAFGRDGAA